jgi:hypothetical protein
MATLLSLIAAASAASCPFCTALRPTITHVRDSAQLAVLAEVVSVDDAHLKFDVHRVLQGQGELTSGDVLQFEEAALSVDGGVIEAGQLAVGGLAFLAADTAADQGDSRRVWKVWKVDEARYAYIARAPRVQLPARQRLEWFLPYLEHPDPWLADEAYLEFGHAPFDEVAELASLMPAWELRRWVLDPAVPDYRKGLYGLCLGLAADVQQRAANATFLREQIVAPAVDFRAGFDGVLGGYLMASGVSALEFLQARYAERTEAALGDVRHFLTALRFYREYGTEIPVERLAATLRKLLVRPELAAEVVVDLARWQDWDALDEIMAACGNFDSVDGPTRRSVVGYLLRSPTAAAAERLAVLRRAYPDLTAQAEESLADVSAAR